MKTFTLLPLAAVLTTAFVVPDQQIFAQEELGSRPHDQLSSSWLKDRVNDIVETSKDAFTDLTDFVREEFSAAESWYETQKHDFSITAEKLSETESEILHDLRRTTSRWQKDLGIPIPQCPHSTKKEEEDEGEFEILDENDDHHHHKRPHHKRPHHGRPPHHHKPKETIYQLIKKSKYTTKLAALVDKFPETVEYLNSTKSNLTLFAPTDSAFKHIPDDAFSKETLQLVLAYHLVPDIYLAGRVLKTRTLPTALWGKGLSVEPKKTPQRISTQISFKGLTLNFYSRVVAIDIFATNGVVHGVNSLLFPPPKAAKIVELIPGYFSTLELALLKTGLLPALNDTSSYKGGVLFAPTNDAWARLGPGANAFLFSPRGKKYLAALIKYHAVPNITLYSDALYLAEPKSQDSVHGESRFHIDMPTLLEDKSLSVDVARFGRIVDIRINGFNHVRVTDVAAYDAVLHLPYSVLIPPRTADGKEMDASTDNISVEELRERLEPFVEKDEAEDEEEFPLELRI